MSIEEQVEIIKAFQRGETIYVKEKYRDKWLQIKITNNVNYKFNFEENEYFLNPKTLQEIVNTIHDPKEALDYTIEDFKECGLIKMLQSDSLSLCQSDSHAFFYTYKHVYALEENDLFKLWNIAMNYGQSNPQAKEINASTS